MTPDESTPIDEGLLAALLAFDAARTPGTDPASSMLPNLPGFVDLIRRLESYEPEATEPVISASSETPLSLGRFAVIREIGRGGFGVVYLARDPVLGRDVALKVPRAEVIVAPDSRRRFLREGRAAAGLDHPHIVPVFEAGEIGPFAYIVSAYCEGPTLSTWLRERTHPVAARMACRLIADLADAVQHAHERGVLHRDLKPSNILLQHGFGSPGSDVPSPRITDFGLARIMEEGTNAEETRSGVPLGSPPYMAPEQAAGKRREIGPATDVYSLGATLYEILSGRPPFQGESYLETLGQVLADDPVPPRALRPGLPRDLETICLKCLEKETSRRYQTASALRADIERFLRGEPILARPISARLRAAKWVRRRPLLAAILILAGLLASVLIGGIVYRDVLLQEHTRQLEREVTRADANARLARRHLQADQLRRAREALDSHQVERAQDILSAIQSDRASSGIDLDPGDPGFPWHYLRRLACREVVVLSDRQAERIMGLALSRDGRTLATGDQDGTIRLRDPETGAPRITLPGHRFPVINLAFAPDGRRLVSAGTDTSGSWSSEVFLWDLVSKRRLASLEGFSDHAVEDLRFDPRGEHLWDLSLHQRDGRRMSLWDVRDSLDRPLLRWSRPTRATILPVTRDGRIVVLEATGRRFVMHDIVAGKDLGSSPPIDHHYELAVPSPDGRLVALGRGSRVVSLWDVASGREKTRYELSREDLDGLWFGPDGRYLALDFRDGDLEIRDVIAGGIRSIPAGISGPNPWTERAFSPDGRFLARSVSRYGVHRPTTIWQLDPWGLVATYPAMLGDTDTLRFTGDGRALIQRISMSAIRWNDAAHPELAQPDGHGDEAWSVAFSPDGSILASGSDDDNEARTIKLWEAGTGKFLRGWKAGPGTVSELAFDRRGRILASAHLDTTGEVRLWDPSTGRRIGALAGHTDRVRTVAFSPDGGMLASAGSDREIRLWDMATRRCRVLIGHANAVRGVAFSPDGMLLASASNDFSVRLWDSTSGVPIRTMMAIAPVASVAFAPDGQSLAAADEKGMVSIWDVRSGGRVRSMAFEQDYFLSLAFSPDGRSLAVAGKTRTIRIWDPATGQEVLTLEGHKAQVNGLAFSPDGTTLASCSHDGAVRLWRSGP